MEIDWEIRKLSHGNALALGVSYNMGYMQIIEGL